MDKPDCDITTTAYNRSDKNNAVNHHDNNDDNDDDCVILEEINTKSPKRLKTATLSSQSSLSSSVNDNNGVIEDGIIGMKVRSPNNRPNKFVPISPPNPTSETSDS